MCASEIYVWYFCVILIGDMREYSEWEQEKSRIEIVSYVRIKEIETCVKYCVREM